MEFTCDTCGAVFSTQKSLQRHVRAQHLGEIHSCVHCDRHYKYLSDEAKHEQDCTGKQIKCQQNICDFCGRIYRHKQGLNNIISFIAPDWLKTKGSERGECICFLFLGSDLLKTKVGVSLV